MTNNEKHDKISLKVKHLVTYQFVSLKEDGMKAETLLENYSPREIWAHLEEFLKQGYDINDIIEIGPPYASYFVDNHKKLLRLGADAANLFYESRSKYEGLVNHPDILVRDLKTFVDYGLDKKVAKNWLEANVKKEDIVLNYKEFKFFGIDPTEYIPDYLESHDPMRVWNQVFFGVGPKLITPEVYVNYYDINTISEAFWNQSSKTSYGFSVFIEEYACLGGNIDLLTKKIKKAYGGYPEDEDKLVVLSKLLEYGAKEIDANKIIDSLTYQAYYYQDKESREFVNNYFYRTLQEYADEAHLEKLKTAN